MRETGRLIIPFLNTLAAKLLLERRALSDFGGYPIEDTYLTAKNKRRRETVMTGNTMTAVDCGSNFALS